MTRFSIFANWQLNLLDVADMVYVDELCGSIEQDGVGQGHLLSAPSGFSKYEFISYLKTVHQKGLKFNYLLDTTCMGNRELTISGQRRLRKLLEWLIENNIDAVSVSIPYLLEFIKYNYPKLKAYVSIMGGVDSLERAKYWDRLGADRITLSAVSGITRNFTLLRKMREGIGCQLELIANLSCLNECPFWTYHAAVCSHLYQVSNHRQKGIIDYCSAKCNYIKIKDPVEFIRSGWIRPEDLHHYEELGIERIKIVNGNMDNANMIKILKAYSFRRYNGNLLDLFFDRPEEEFGIYIDNQKLDGFLEYFMREDCSLKSCRVCNYCTIISKRVVRIDNMRRLNLMDKYERKLNETVSSF